MASQRIRIRLKAFDHRLIDQSAREIVERSLHIAADICVYTNHNLTIEELGPA